MKHPDKDRPPYTVYPLMRLWAWETSGRTVGEVPQAERPSRGELVMWVTSLPDWEQETRRLRGVGPATMAWLKKQRDEVLWPDLAKALGRKSLPWEP